jgi:hypothetical protein
MRLAKLLALLVMAACTPLAGSPGDAPPTTAAPLAVGGCPVTAPVTNEKPRNTNTAAFSNAWYVSPDRRLWASAGSRRWEGGNKVLWERPGSRVEITGKLLIGGGRKSAGVPTITDGRGYESLDYEASGLTFPTPGCWEVEARAEGSILTFVTLVYPREYASANRSCIDLKHTFGNSDAVLTASVMEVAPALPEFALTRLAAKTIYKAPAGGLGTLELYVDLAEQPVPHRGDGYVLFLARENEVPWQIVCPFRTLAQIDGAGAVTLTSLRYGSSILPADVPTLDRELRALAR